MEGWNELLPEPIDTKVSNNVNKLRKRLERLSAQAIGDYAMIAEGDLVMVCLSGGKDSYTLLELLLALQNRLDNGFCIVAMNLDQQQPGFPEHVLPDYLKSLGLDHHIARQDTYSVVKEKIPAGKTMCSLCSRLRRGVIYRVAGEVGADKIALGHHRDDILATFFLNMFFGGRLKAMPPKLLSDNGEHTVIRPLAYCREKDITRYARVRDFPIIPRTLCGSQETLQRKAVGDMLRDWERRDTKRLDSIFRALQHVSPSRLMDRDLYDFTGLLPEGVSGDIVFDEPVLES